MLFVVLLLDFFGFILSSDPGILLIETTSGPIQGFIVDNSYKAWLSIPYAENVSGNNRWTSPKPKIYSTKVFNATQQPCGCPQKCNDDPFCPKIMKEDCLCVCLFRTFGAKKIKNFYHFLLQNLKHLCTSQFKNNG